MKAFVVLYNLSCHGLDTSWNVYAINDFYMDVHSTKCFTLLIYLCSNAYLVKQRVYAVCSLVATICVFYTCKPVPQFLSRSHC